MTDTANRVRAVVRGLCAADAISWPSWWHRMAKLTPRREVRLNQAWQHARDMRTTGLPTPYLQSSPLSAVAAAGPTDDAEWFTVAARYHLGRLLDGSRAPDGQNVWTELTRQRAVDENEVRARVGTVIALDNLASGLDAPASGNDNPHYFDDIACVRGVAAGLLRPGNPAAAADLAAQDAEFTHALDGVWGARASAALISALAAGAPARDAESVALAELPAGSWSAHVVAECLDRASDAGDPLRLAALLEEGTVDHVYAYANQVPETLGLLLAHLRVAESSHTLLLGALAHPRHADGLVPLAGAVAGAAFGDQWGNDELPTLQGTCVAALAGVRLDEVVDDLLAAANQPVR
jgi:ADP-ribosylglycohydrolase